MPVIWVWTRTGIITVSEGRVNVEKIVEWFESGKAEDLANWLVLVVFGCLFFVIGSSVVALIVK